MPRERRRSPSGAVLEGEVLRAIAEVRQLAGRDLSDGETGRLTTALDRISEIAEIRASRQLDQLASTVARYRERIERTDREIAELRAENGRLRARGSS